MSFINSILKAFVGDKSQKDVKAIQPLITKIKSFESTLMALSHDELRNKTVQFQEKIKAARAEKDNKIQSLRQEAENTTDVDKKEDFYNAIDALEKEAYEISEKVLKEILPEAFAVVKETARRFKENSSITVTATGGGTYSWSNGTAIVGINFLEFFGNEIEVTQFNLKVPKQQTIVVRGNTFTEEIINLLEKTKKNDVIIISDIKGNI